MARRALCPHPRRPPATRSVKFAGPVIKRLNPPPAGCRLTRQPITRPRLRRLPRLPAESVRRSGFQHIGHDGQKPRGKNQEPEPTPTTRRRYGQRCETTPAAKTDSVRAKSIDRVVEQGSAQPRPPAGATTAPDSTPTAPSAGFTQRLPRQSGIVKMQQIPAKPPEPAKPTQQESRVRIYANNAATLPPACGQQCETTPAAAWRNR